MVIASPVVLSLIKNAAVSEFLAALVLTEFLPENG